VCATCGDERDDLLVRDRKHDGIGHRLAARVVVAVDEALGFVGDETVAAERCTQSIEEFGWERHRVFRERRRANDRVSGEQIAIAGFSPLPLAGEAAPMARVREVGVGCFN
jgi:hypothetical protein